MNFKFGKKDSFDYIKAFVALAEHSCQAAEFLDSILADFTPGKTADNIIRMHEIEHAADAAKHEMLRLLIREFLPPLDKDDIIMLSHQIDEVTDSIEDVLIFIDINDIQSVNDEMLEFSGLIIMSVRHMTIALRELEDYRKSKALYDELNEIHRLKAKGKALYVNSLKNIRSISNDPVQMMVYMEMYSRLLECCANCKEVTNTIERIVIKNL